MIQYLKSMRGPRVARRGAWMPPGGEAVFSPLGEKIKRRCPRRRRIRWHRLLLLDYHGRRADSITEKLSPAIDAGDIIL